MTSLYKLSAEYAAIRQRLMETQDDEQTVSDTLESEGWELEQKILGAAYAIKDMEALIASRKEALKEMQDAIRREENRLERLKNYLLTAMQMAGMNKVQGKHFDVRLKKKAQGVVIADESLIPEAFYRMPEVKPPSPVIDKLAIKEALTAGQDVPGVHLDSGIRLDIR